MIYGKSGWRRLGVAGVGIAAVVVLAFPAGASAAAPELVVRIFNDQVAAGSGAGELDWPSAIVADPDTGHVFVSEGGNDRISEYTAWGLFVKSWGWGVLDGSPELQICGPAEPEAEPPPALCRRGIEGGGAGQLLRAAGIAMDPAGDLYVFERANLRVQKFSPDGEFLLMFGGKVNKTKVEAGGASEEEENICTAASGDVCQAGTAGSASGSFATNLFSDAVEYSPGANAILVGDKGRIQEFNLDGTFKGEIPFAGALGALAGMNVRGLDVGPDGNTYLTVSGLDNVYKLSPAGVPLDPGKPNASQFAVPGPGVVTVDHNGNVYAVSGAKVLEFDFTAKKLVPTETEEEAGVFFPNLELNPQLFALATNRCVGSGEPGSLYIGVFLAGNESYVDVYGSGPTGCEPPPAHPPVVDSQYAVSVKSESARLQARINPYFWSDTAYRLEYGTGKCSEGGCDQVTVLQPLTDKSVKKALKIEEVALGGLEPGTTYRYRFVAQSSGGGPVYGVDPDGEGKAMEASFEEGLEGSFTTFPEPDPAPQCANDGFRGGAAAGLPDCRAYELVSPLDKGNGDAALLPSTQTHLELNQSATSGERFTYSSITSFAEPESAPFVTQLLARRGADGWSSASISPPRSKRALFLGLSLNNEFKGFSADLCQAWLVHNSIFPLTAEAIPGYANAYRRENCSEPAAYAALSPAQPSNRPAAEFLPNVLGFSADGTTSVFVADGKLTAEAPSLPPGELLLYMHSKGEGLRFVCRLPNGMANPTACGAGMVAGNPIGQASAVQNAVSADGSRVFWTAYSGTVEISPKGVPGQIYLRKNPDQEQSAISGGECTEAERACTIAVSGSVSPEPAEYWGAAEDGSTAIFKIAKGPLAGNLYSFDVESETASPIATGVLGPMGVSEDAKRVYFATSKNLGDGGSEGGRNLYLYEAGEGGPGTLSFIMGLAAGDIQGNETTPKAIDEVPIERSSRVSPDGLHAAFVSAASPTPTGYDNRDAHSDEPNLEAYLYDAVEEELRCISCNPTGARPVGAGVREAARLAKQRTPLHAPRTLAEDGSRVFFESHEALVPRDTNGTWDVYQWEEPGKGGCKETSASFGEAAGGCVDLLSSGDSEAESRFLDADPTGENVFIGTQSSLIAADFGSNDVYDVRVGGGFPTPQHQPSCEGEACQSPPPAPEAIAPGSSAYQGPGNPRPSKLKPRRCRKGAHKGKARCARKGARGKPRKRASRHRRTTR